MLGARGRWIVLLIPASLVGFIVPSAAAEDEGPSAPPTARCDYPNDLGAGAAGAGVAVSHASWETQWSQLCVQTTSPREIDIVEVGADGPGCDYEDRDAVELYVDRDSAKIESKSSCDDQHPDYTGEGRTQDFTSCAVAVSASDDDLADQSCREQGRDGGDPSGTTWEGGHDNSSSITVTVGDGEVTVTRSRTVQDSDDVDGSFTETVSVGVGGVERTYVSDYPEAGEDGFHCEDSWSVSPTDPLAGGVPPETPGCL